MKYQNFIHRALFTITLLAFNLTLQINARAEDPTSICRRLPAIPAPQTASTLRLLTAYAMPTIIAQFGTGDSETDYVYQKLAARGEEQTLRDFTRTAQPYYWEFSLFWSFSELPAERTLTPLTEAYQHHENRLREAYKICRAFNAQFFVERHKPNISNIYNATLLEQILSTLEEQRITALIQLYAPQAIIPPSANFSASSIATGDQP